jgi:hypothetical protein
LLARNQLPSESMYVIAVRLSTGLNGKKWTSFMLARACIKQNKNQKNLKHKEVLDSEEKQNTCSHHPRADLNGDRRGLRPPQKF